MERSFDWAINLINNTYMTIQNLKGLLKIQTTNYTFNGFRLFDYTVEKVNFILLIYACSFFLNIELTQNNYMNLILINIKL